MEHKLTKEEISGLVGEFTWDFGQCFFIETEVGNFVWSDPDYNGDNSLTLFDGDILDFFRGDIHSEYSDFFGRDKGMHFIRDYCGEDFILKEG